MGRTKGATNKKPAIEPLCTSMASSERIALIANLIVDKICDDHNNGYKLLHKIDGQRDESTTTTI